MSRPEDGSLSVAQGEVHSLLKVFSMAFAAVLVTGIALGVYFSREVGPGPFAEEAALRAEEVSEPEPVDPGAGSLARGRSATPPASVPARDTSAMAFESTRPSPVATRPAPKVAALSIGVRVGVFRSAANADGMESRLREAGLEPLVVRFPSGGGELHYVYAGIRNSQREAQAFADILQAQGLDTWIEEVALGSPRKKP